MPELLQPREHVAVVKTVDRVIDAATNTFRVRLELPNPGGALPAGLRCKVDLGLKLPRGRGRLGQPRRPRPRRRCWRASKDTDEATCCSMLRRLLAA